MADVKFVAGQHVSILRGPSFAAGGPRGVYRIVAALPKEMGQQRYRVRSDGETHDRIVDEVRLEAVGL
ncbi:MAG TPA: hypothetical protein VEF55_14415 [Candidatus Binatia bacterium]|nr:hypothetical protein [Candidatus Binatia bacterium]